MTTRIVPLAEEPELAVALAGRSIARQASTPLLEPPPEFDADAAARGALARYVDSTDDGVRGYLALDEDRRPRALLGAMLEVPDEHHPSYTYMPPAYALTPLSAWHVETADDLALVRPLVDRLAEDSAERGIPRLMVQTRPHDWIAGSAWRALGLRPDSILAARRTLPALDPGMAEVVIRPADRGDEDALVDLAHAEHEYHAVHTRTGTRAGQPDAPTRRVVREWLGAERSPGALVAVGDGGVVLGCLALHEMTIADGSAGRAYYPERYGYVGLTSVLPGARGRGIGRALTATALDEFRNRGHDHVMLHYVDDNALSRPFWDRLGFTPHVVTLAGDVLNRKETR